VTLTAQALYSGIFDSASTALFVRTFAGASAKWKGMKTTPHYAAGDACTQRYLAPPAHYPDKVSVVNS
jgi:hypothetical protein